MRITQAHVGVGFDPECMSVQSRGPFIEERKLRAKQGTVDIK